jgi:hypothetical protein
MDQRVCIGNPLPWTKLDNEILHWMLLLALEQLLGVLGELLHELLPQGDRIL